MKFPQSFLRATALSIVFAAAGAAQITFSPATLPNGAVGSLYQQDISVGLNAPVHYAIAQGTLPPGLTITDFSPPSNTGQVGRIAGTPTTAGTYPFTIHASDTSGPNVFSQTKDYTIVITAAGANPLTVSPTNLKFSGIAGGDATTPQAISVTAPTAGEVYTPIVDDGNGGAAPSWLRLNVATGTFVRRTPARIVAVGDPGSLSAGTYSARIRLLNSTGNAVAVPITFEVKAGAPQLQVAPTFLRFASRVVAPGLLEQPIVVSNAGGGGPVNFQATIVNSSPWITITPASGQTGPNAPVLIRVRVNTAGLPVGGYSDVVRITSNAGSTDVRVNLLVQQNGPILTLDKTGLRFNIRQGNSNGASQTVAVYNTGSPNTTITWTTTQRSSSNFLAFTPAGGTATPTNHGTINLTLNSNAPTLPVGAYYTLVTVSDPKAFNSPQVFVAVLEVADAAATPATPELVTSGASFAAVLGGAAPTAQGVTLSTSSNAAVGFQVQATTNDGAAWLSATPASGTVSATSSVLLVISVDPTKLSRAGIYTGTVDVAINGIVRSVAVVLTLLPQGATLSTELDEKEAAKARAVTGCTPTRAVITPLGIPGGFSIPAAWPTTLAAMLTDDCGTPLAGGSGSVVASFDNGDAPLTLSDYQQTGSYVATWTPAFPAGNMAVTLRGASELLQPATAQVAGGINANKFAPPVLFDNGTVNNTNPVAGALLAPGAVTAAYGQNLASNTVSPGVIPLLETFNGTTILVAGLPAPFYFLSGGQLNVETPVELAPNQQASVAVQVNSAYAVLPNGVLLVPAAPGIASFPDTKIIAQHADFTLITSASPSKAGESIVSYVSGMGSSTPSYATGQQASLTELGPAKIQPTVTVDGANASVLYAGLTPGGIGLYQINFTVPASTRPGDATVVITQNGIVANVTKLPVGAP